MERAYQYCLVDPEGDYEELKRATVLGTPDRAPTVDEALDMLADPGAHVVLNLLGVRLDDRPGFLEALLPRIQQLQSRTGRPHWIVIDEAHHLLPAGLQTTETAVPRHLSSLLMVTVHSDSMSPEALGPVNVVLTPTNGAADSLRTFAEARGIQVPSTVGEEGEGRAVAWFLPDEPFAFMPAEPSGERRRHVRKYAQGDLQDKAFYFRGPEERLNLRAQNLALFAQLAEGVDDETWQWHLGRGDYTRWFREAVKDDGLADAAEEASGDHDPAASRRRILDAIADRYTLPAETTP